MNTQLQKISFIFALIVPACVHAASFDCAKAASPTEKLICGNPSVSLLDEQLGQTYKQALASTNDKDLLKQEQMGWLKQQRACKDADCLTKTYLDRIERLQKNETAIAPAQQKQATTVSSNAAPKKAHFYITEGDHLPLCQAYLTVLNRTPWDDLKPCQLPDLTGSSIQEVTFTPVTGQLRTKLDQMVVEQTMGQAGPKWEDVRAAREKQYESGYLSMGSLQWDLNQDGKDDFILETPIPSSHCEPLISETAHLTFNDIDAQWDALTEAGQLAKSKQYGFKKFYSLIEGNTLFFISGENLVTFSGKYYSIMQNTLIDKINHKQKPDGISYVEIFSINNKVDAKNRSYGRTSADCKFALKK